MTEELLAQLEDPDPKTRRLAAKELRSVAEPRVRRAFLSRLSDPDEIVRRNAVLGLANWDEPQIASSILSLLDDPSFEVRCAVIQVVEKLSYRGEETITRFRQRYWDIANDPRSRRKKGSESREYDLLQRFLFKEDPNLTPWLEERRRAKSDEELTAVKKRIDEAQDVAKQAAHLLTETNSDVVSWRHAARAIGSAYFYRYILAYLFENSSELRWLPGKSLPGTLVISLDLSFERSWVGVATAFDLRFNATGGEAMLNPLFHSLVNDEHEEVRYECAHMCRVLKDERAIPALTTLANRCPETWSDDGEEARDAISEIQSASETITLAPTTGEEFAELARHMDQGTQQSPPPRC